VACAIPISFFIVRGITGPLSHAVTTLQLVAGGDLTASLAVHTKDEIGQMATALNAALEKIRSTLQDVAESAANSGSSSRELAAAAEQIASGAQQQAASLEETSASLEEITAAVRQSADNARQASQLAQGSRESAEQGEGVVSGAIAAMAEINYRLSELLRANRRLLPQADESSPATRLAWYRAPRAGPMMRVLRNSRHDS
jgi:methyl-accepting chemotaxis protein